MTLPQISVNSVIIGGTYILSKLSHEKFNLKVEIQLIKIVAIIVYTKHEGKKNTRAQNVNIQLPHQVIERAKKTTPGQNLDSCHHTFWRK